MVDPEAKHGVHGIEAGIVAQAGVGRHAGEDEGVPEGPLQPPALNVVCESRGRDAVRADKNTII